MNFLRLFRILVAILVAAIAADADAMPSTAETAAEGSDNLSKVTTDEAETEKKNPIFFPGYAECSHNLSKVTTKERKNNKLA